ncbi:MAG: hypothetical protein GXY34_11785 [Syntrophomonadaceae bacterium]|nr:hypothetical protein [Syntrophomonadaceae bacterium]
MRQWRVGTLSMGLLLLSSGIGLLYAQLNRIAVMDLALKWWPLILILLGIEVLIQYYFRKDEQSKIKYDGFSIIMILIIVFSGVAIQTASHFGLTDYVQRELRSADYELTTPTTKVDAGKARNIIIHAESAPHLVVRDSSSQEVSIYGRGHIRAESREEAVKKLAENVQVTSRQDGDTLYIDLEAGIYLYNYYLTLPANAAIEMELNSTSIDISPASINNNWVIKGGSRTKVTLMPGANILVSVLDANPSSIYGNVSWLDRDGKTLVDLRQEQQARDNYGEMNENPDNSPSEPILLQTTVGKPDHKLTLMESSEVSVNILP